MNYQQNPNGMIPMQQQQTAPSLKANKMNRSMGFETLMPLISFVLIVGIFLMSAYALFFNANESVTQRILRKASQVTTLNNNEMLGAAVVQIEDVESLKAENEIQKEIYKDVQNGDFAVVLSNRMIIYRESSNQKIYEGNTPSQELNSRNQAQLTTISDAAKADGIIAQDSTSTPQVLVVTDVAQLQTQNPTFYANVQANDLLVIYAAESKIFVFRPSTNQIVQKGNVTTNITL